MMYCNAVSSFFCYFAERISNMVASLETEDQSRSCIEDWLELAHQVDRKADPYTIPVVQSEVGIIVI